MAMALIAAMLAPTALDNTVVQKVMMMRTQVELNDRRFNPTRHVHNLLAGEWLKMVNEHGEALPGIRGRVGVAALTQAGIEIGADVIELQPGHAFPDHVHSGEHILYVIAGQGVVSIDGMEHPLQVGDVIFIPAEYPHNVKNPAESVGPFMLLTVGYPHKHIAAQDRMRTVEALTA